MVCGGIAFHCQGEFAERGRRLCDGPREHFVGPGPWLIKSPMNLAEYWMTEDADPRRVYHDVLIAAESCLPAAASDRGACYIKLARHFRFAGLMLRQ